MTFRLFLFIPSVDGMHGTKVRGIDQQRFDSSTSFFLKMLSIQHYLYRLQYLHACYLDQKTFSLFLFIFECRKLRAAGTHLDACM